MKHPAPANNLTIQEAEYVWEMEDGPSLRPVKRS